MDFAKVLNERFGFSFDDAQTSARYFIPTPYKNKQYFLKQGEIAQHLGIVVEGLMRTYFINDEADEITTAFHEPVSLALSAESFNKCIPSKENIVAIDDSLVLQILAKDWLMLYDKVPQWRFICKLTSDEYGYKLADRTTGFQTLSAKQRYEQFIKNHPLVVQKTALKHIASYLGIDIATLSRIRKSIGVH